MGMSYLVYPGAHHTRFHHALGCMHIMQKARNILRRIQMPEGFDKRFLTQFRDRCSVLDAFERSLRSLAEGRLDEREESP